MIDPKTGRITLSPTVQINPRDRIDQVATFNFGVSQVLRDMQTGWKWLTVKNVIVAENYHIITFGFYRDVLFQVNLVVAADRFDLSQGWKTWSEVDELNTLTQLQQWLLTKLGREGVFGWGTIRTNYDPKGGGSSIRITYTA
ncbi:MAG: hypothetical protein H7319_13190 [Spirosoma sp.]|nr:hypothetical protein [Spirosoma sp.]